MFSESSLSLTIMKKDEDDEKMMNSYKSNISYINS